MNTNNSLRSGLFALLLILITLPSVAQFNENTKIFNLGTGLIVNGRLNHPNKLDEFLSEDFMPIHFSYEFGLPENSFAQEYSKNVTLGLYLNFHHQGYSKLVTSNMYTLYKRWNTVNLGISGTFHFLEYIPKNIISLDDSKFDIYGRVNAGVTIEGYKANFLTDPNDNQAISGGIYENGINYFPNLSLSLGGRYRFSKPLAVFAEIGGGSYNLLTFGLSWTK